MTLLVYEPIASLILFSSPPILAALIGGLIEYNKARELKKKEAFEDGTLYRVITGIGIGLLIGLIIDIPLLVLVFFLFIG